MVRDRLPLNGALSGHWLITGAGRGIGAAVAREVRGREPSAQLSLVDLDGEAARAVAAELGRATGFETDLSQVTRLPELLRELQARSGPVDVLVNNAGVMWVGDATALSAERSEALLTIDLLAPVRLVQLVLPDMRRRARGGIVNVASLAGVTPLRGCTVYAAAKAGVAHYSETLRAEVLPHGIDVLTVYPGPVRTELEREARRGLRATWASRAAPVGEPEVLARRIYEGLRFGAPRVVYPRSYELAWRFPRLASWITARFSPPAHAPEVEQRDQAPPVCSDGAREHQTLAHSG